MSAAAYLVIRCDACGEEEVGTPFHVGTHHEVRKHNRPAGWRFTRDGRDLGPKCSGATPER